VLHDGGRYDSGGFTAAAVQRVFGLCRGPWEWKEASRDSIDSMERQQQDARGEPAGTESPLRGGGRSGAVKRQSGREGVDALARIGRVSADAFLTIASVRWGAGLLVLSGAGCRMDSARASLRAERLARLAGANALLTNPPQH
jgi:hypothetical protein